MSKKNPAPTKSAKKSEPGPKQKQNQAAENLTDEALVDAHQEAFQAAGEAAEETVGKVEQRRAELEEAKDRALRSQAELENYRKRAQRQIEEERRYANMALIRDLLPVWDNIGRAIEAAEKTHETSSLLEGFKMTSRQLEDVLARHHCSRIEALHEPFDPNLHEAISQQPSDEHPANTVLYVTQVGFQLHDRVVRPSQVVVSAAVPKAEDQAETKQEKQEEEQES